MATIVTPLWTISVLLLNLNPGQHSSTYMESKRIQEFRTLSGCEQVQMLLHGTSILRKAFTTDFQMEEEILVASSDPAVDGCLVAEARHGNTGTAQEAIFMICERARFVPSPDFPVKVSLGFVTGVQDGMINPFPLDLSRVRKDASDAVKDSLNSPNAKVRRTARIYCGGLENELASLPANELVERWRSELGKLQEPLFADYDSSETGELVRVLKRALAERGLEGATALSLMLDRETKPWARESEIEMIEFLDGAAVRLRGSQKGRDVINIVERTVLNKQLRLNRTREERERYWNHLQGTFFKDEYTITGTDRDHWTKLLGLAFEQYYGDHVLVSDSRLMRSFPKANEFMAYLTDIDPAFPSWEFTSTLSEKDMFHPRFAAKMARYHALWVEMNASRRTR